MHPVPPSPTKKVLHVIPGRLWHHHRSAVSKQSGPGNAPGITGPKQMWDRACPGSAARAALDFKGARNTKTGIWWPSCGCRRADRMSVGAPCWGLQQGYEAPSDVVVLLLRSSAARAALPGQARSHICFGPVMPVRSLGPPCLFTTDFCRENQLFQQSVKNPQKKPASHKAGFFISIIDSAIPPVVITPATMPMVREDNAPGGAQDGQGGHGSHSQFGQFVDHGCLLVSGVMHPY